MVKMSAVWDRSVEFISENLGVLLPVALLAFFVPAAIEGNFSQLRETGGAALELLLSLLSVAFALVSLWGTLAIVAMAGDAGKVKDGAVVGRARLPAAIVVWVAVLVVLMLLTLPAPILLWLRGVDMMAIARGEEVALPTGITAPVALYYLLYIAFAIWAMARLIVVTPVIVHESRMFGALRRSFLLTRGVSLPVIGVLLLLVLVASVSILATQTVFGSLFRLIAGGEAGLSLASVLTSVMVAAVQTAFSVLTAVFMAKLYLVLIARERTVTT